MQYYYEIQSSQDGKTWVTDEKMAALPRLIGLPVRINSAGNILENFRRYVEYEANGSNPLVIYQGERTGDETFTWRPANAQRGKFTEEY